jgi:hypothetical protein
MNFIKMLLTLSKTIIENYKRNHCYLWLLIDISGSMSELVLTPGDKESLGITRLDIALHCARTVGSSLNDDDKLGIIFYNSNAYIAFPMMHMTDDNKKKLYLKLSNIRPTGGTNMWSAIELCITNVDKDKKIYTDGIYHSIMLSDGQNNQGNYPIKELINYISIHHRLSFTLNMLGFSNDCDSNFCMKIAEIGNGLFSFIPDAGMIGTITVHMLSNTLVRNIDNIELHIQLMDGKRIDDASNYLPITYSDGTNVIKIGITCYEQDRHFILNIKDCENFTEDMIKSIKLVARDFNKILSLDDKYSLKIDFSNCNQTIVEKIRSDCIKLLGSIIDIFKDPFDIDKLQLVETHVKLQIEHMKKIEFKDELLDGLIHDFETQIYVAVSSKKYFNEWGLHYIRSLYEALANEYCPNFKDQSVANYGGNEFNKERDNCDEKFIEVNSVCPLVPSRKPYNVLSTSNQTQPIDITRFNNSAGGCISGDSSIQLYNGKIKLVKDITKSDIVKSLSGYSEVLCVVRTKYNKKINMIKLESGLIITPWHPIFYNDEWQFPINIKQAQLLYCDYVYNFITKDNICLVINNLPCVVLGHGIKNNICKHPYFSSIKSIQDICNHPDYKSGLVTLNEKSFCRDINTNLINKIIY